MTAPDAPLASSVSAAHPLARPLARPLCWVTPGPLRQVTGGYLYDARIVDGLRAAGWRVGVLDIRASRWPLDAPAGRRLVNGLSRERWSAVVVDELAHPALAAALLTGNLTSALAGAPLALLVHHLRQSEPASWPQRALAHLVEARAVRAADLVVCTSETTARSVRPMARPGVQVAVVRPGWDTHGDLTPPAPLPCRPRSTGPLRYAVSPCRGANIGDADIISGAEREENESLLPPLRVGEGVRADGLSLLLVGHWTPRKGILLALAAVERADPRVTLDLVGEQDRDPAYAAQVRAALQAPRLVGRVRVHGRVSDQELTRLYAQADALLMPSTHEGYGMVLAEALAAGLPIIATRVGAIPEVVRDGQEAILVPVDDASALTRAIDRLAWLPDERARRATLARERACALPAWADSLLLFQRLLDGLVRTPRDTA